MMEWVFGFIVGSGFLIFGFVLGLIKGHHDEQKQYKDDETKTHAFFEKLNAANNEIDKP